MISSNGAFISVSGVRMSWAVLMKKRIFVGYLSLFLHDDYTQGRTCNGNDDEAIKYDGPDAQPERVFNVNVLLCLCCHIARRAIIM